MRTLRYNWIKEVSNKCVHGNTFFEKKFPIHSLRQCSSTMFKSRNVGKLINILQILNIPNITLYSFLGNAVECAEHHSVFREARVEKH